MYSHRHAQLALFTWQELQKLISDTTDDVYINGRSLTIAAVIAIAWYAQYYDQSQRILTFFFKSS